MSIIRRNKLYPFALSSNSNSNNNDDDEEIYFLNALSSRDAMRTSMRPIDGDVWRLWEQSVRCASDDGQRANSSHDFAELDGFLANLRLSLSLSLF